MADYKIYKLSEETLAGIIKGNRDAINLFYFDNLVQFKKHARKYVARKIWNDQHDYDVDDLLTQIYIDIPFFNFASDSNIYYSIKNSMWASVVGGIENIKQMKNECNFQKAVRLNAPVSDDEDDAAELIDFLLSSPGIEEDICNDEYSRESDARALALLKKIYKGKQFKLAYEIFFNGRSYSAARRGVL